MMCLVWRDVLDLFGCIKLNRFVGRYFFGQAYLPRSFLLKLEPGILVLSKWPKVDNTFLF